MKCQVIKQASLAKYQLTAFSNTSTTSRWLLRAARWRAVNPSSFGSLIDNPGGRLGIIIFVALHNYIIVVM